MSGALFIWLSYEATAITLSGGVGKSTADKYGLAITKMIKL